MAKARWRVAQVVRIMMHDFPGTRKRPSFAKVVNVLRNYLRGRLRRMLNIRKATLARIPGVLNVGTRAVAREITISGVRYFKKTYNGSASANVCFRREVLAREIFRSRDWMPKIVKLGENWFLLPYYSPDNRLDHLAPGLTCEQRLFVATQAVSAMFDIFMEGYAHCDFHVENLFWVDQTLVITDFEMLTPYAPGKRPPFPLSYDLTGEGLESPERTGNMCYIKEHQRGVSLENTLGIAASEAVSMLVKQLKEELKLLSKTFQTRKARHECRADRIYCSFELPHLAVSPEEAQRNSALRLHQFGVSELHLDGKKLLDLGSNVGGMIFEAQKFRPQYSLGVEFDRDKVDLCRRIAAFNGLNNVEFLQADIDRLAAAEVSGPFDVVFCLAIEAHLKKPKRLYTLLSELCAGFLCFEGNSTTSAKDVEGQLRRAGFQEVRYLGISSDDCIDSNNRRPILVAHKNKGALPRQPEL